MWKSKREKEQNSTHQGRGKQEGEFICSLLHPMMLVHNVNVYLHVQLCIRTRYVVLLQVFHILPKTPGLITAKHYTYMHGPLHLTISNTSLIPFLETRCSDFDWVSTTIDVYTGPKMKFPTCPVFQNLVFPTHF